MALWPGVELGRTPLVLWYNGTSMKSVPMRSMALVVLRRPRLWGEAVRAIPAFARKQWWRHPPFLPLPDPEYVQWRVATAYGSSDVEPVPEDVAGYLEWMRRQRH